MTILADHITALQSRGRDTVVTKRLLDLPLTADTNTAANLYIIALDEIVRLQNERKAMLTRLYKLQLDEALPSDEGWAEVAGMTPKQWRTFVKELA